MWWLGCVPLPLSLGLSCEAWYQLFQGHDSCSPCTHPTLPAGGEFPLQHGLVDQDCHVHLIPAIKHELEAFDEKLRREFE